MKINEYIKIRVNRLFTLDKIRLLKFLEIFQYTTIFILLTIFVSFIWNKVFNYFI